MLTDRAPFEYVYLSQRLLRDVVLHDEAARGRGTWSGGINARLLSLQRQRKLPDLSSR